MIDTAVLLAAGMGSRLRAATPYKPLCRISGVALIDHALSGLAAAGIERAVVVLGYGAEAIVAHLAERPRPLAVATVLTDPAKPNGVSALAARRWLDGGEALLVMCDHLVDPALYARLARAGAGDGLRLGIDRRLGHPWVDPLDVTCVATRGDAITAIGKELEPHDCYDTGVFAVGPRLFEALTGLRQPSLTEGRACAVGNGRGRERSTSATSTGSTSDDPPALAHAEGWLATRAKARVAAA